MRLTAVLGILAIVALTASPAPAQSYFLPYHAGDSGFITYNLFNSPLENPPPAQLTNWANPYATMRGAMWINSGSGPALMPGGSSLNMELWVNDYDNEWGSGGDGTGGADGWLLEQRVLVSDGGANKDILGGDPGCFDAGGSELGVPGTYWADAWTDGDQMDTRFQFHLYAWTGTETSYAAALVAGDSTADAIWTQNVAVPCDGALGQGPPAIPPGLNNPAMILENLPGDANRDGKVDINDLTVVLANYNTPGSSLDVSSSQGDFNGDGRVDINDLTIVLANYNQTIGSSAGRMAAVPEPSCVVLLGVGAIGLSAFAWRRKTKA